MTKEINEVLEFWYDEQHAKKWFNSTPEFDAEIKQRFEAQWQCAVNYELDSWQQTPDGCLALCIVLDQFPLNMYRDEAKSFQTEQQAVEVTKKAIAMGFDEKIDQHKVAFLYMPLMHSEDINDQNLSVACFEKRGLESNLRFAEHHRGLIQEFGRFPHRNEILGRENTPEEITYLNSERAFTG